MDKKNKSMNTKEMILSALFIALVFVTTRFINIKLPFVSNGGLVHLGNVMLFSISILFGRKHGAISGAFGMGLFDIVSGWAAWAPFTFIVRGVMGYMIGSIADRDGKSGGSIVWNSLGILVGGVWMIIGYYITEVVLYRNLLVPINSIPGNITQIVFGAVVALPLAVALKKTRIIFTINM